MVPTEGHVTAPLVSVIVKIHLKGLHAANVKMVSITTPIVKVGYYTMQTIPWILCRMICFFFQECNVIRIFSDSESVTFWGQWEKNAMGFEWKIQISANMLHTY